MSASHSEQVGVAGQVRAHLQMAALNGLEWTVEEGSCGSGTRRARIMFLT